MRKIAALVLTMASLSLPAAAEFGPVGNPFHVPSGALGTDAAGNFVAAWYRNSMCPGVGQGCAWVRMYDPFGNPRGETIMVTGGPFYIQGIDVAVAPQGHFAVMWGRREMGWHEVLYRLYDARGRFVAEAHLAWDYLTRLPAADCDAAGSFFFTYFDRGDRGDKHVYATVINATGKVLVTPFAVEQDPSPYTRRLGMVADWNGGFTVFWTRREKSATLARRFSASGEPSSPPFPVEDFASVAGGRHGEFVSTWLGPDPAGHSVLWARVYPAQGTLPGEPFQVSAAPPSAVGNVAVDARGDMVFAWTQRDAAYARRHHADGTPFGPPFRVNPMPAGAEDGARVLCEPVGHCLFTWVRTTPRYARLGQRYHARRSEQPLKGDFDGDQRADLVLCDTDTGELRWWTLVDGARTSDVPVCCDTPSMTWSYAGDGDFDGDGSQDVVLRRDSDGELGFWLLDGPKVRQALPLLGASAPSSAWALVATGDFTRDGWPDLVFQHHASGRLEVWRLAGTLLTAVLVPTPEAPADPGWVVVAAQDWNGDGTRDLLFSNATSGRLVQWLLDPDLHVIGGRFTNPAAPSDPSWQVVASGEYGTAPWGRLGEPDVVWRNATSGRQVIWFLNSAGNRTGGIFTNPPAPANPALVACGPR